MTHIYFVRHAQPDYDVHDNMTRPLTEKGRQDCGLVTDYFGDRGVAAVFSSPYRRAVDTVSGLARRLGLCVTTDPGFAERKIADSWIEDYFAYAQRQWEDFDYKLPTGESLRETQQRNLAALYRVLDRHRDQTVVIGSHGAALSTVIHHYDSAFAYENFVSIIPVMPWVVHFVFEGRQLVRYATVDLHAAAANAEPSC